MLFDLRGRGRRRTVQVIYVGLAIIFLLGFVGLGVGGGFGSGGIFSAFTNSEGTGGTSYSSEIKKYQQVTQREPNNVAAWEKLVLAQLHQAGGEAYVTRTGVTSKGKELYVQIANSWKHYLALNPAQPNLSLAKEMLVVFTEEGLNDPASAVQVLQIIVAAEPNSTHYYSFLADYAYKSKNTRVGDLASEKAVALAPAAQRERLKTELAALKKNPTGSTESAVATTNGKTFTVKSGGNGTYTGTVPTTGSSTIKK
ncbi:MAG TPA: hypothetical protein VGX51_06670 [Solirubrobacteraceae bacterium]|jgi:hypothetical protein|nr:hypothetical protein [Solirubrobacteraceae bacterium]